MSSVPDPVVPAPAAKKRRKPRRPAVALVERKRGPVRTLAARLRDMGPHHEEAARVLGKQFKAELRDALDLERKIVGERATLRSAQGRIDAASRRLASLLESSEAAQETVARLDRLAKVIATEKGDLPDEEPRDSTLDGSGTPADTAPPRHDDE